MFTQSHQPKPISGNPAHQNKGLLPEMEQINYQWIHPFKALYQEACSVACNACSAQPSDYFSYVPLPNILKRIDVNGNMHQK